MILNNNFDSRLESTINTCPPLADWFERNQETMAYFELTHPGCLGFDSTLSASKDLKVLGKMAKVSLAWLVTPTLKNKPKERAINAALAIAEIYEEEQDELSDVAKERYYIDVESLQKSKVEENGVKKTLHN